MNILDPRFKYTPSHLTDIRVLFARERLRLAQAATKALILPLRKDQPHGK